MPQDVDARDKPGHDAVCRLDLIMLKHAGLAAMGGKVDACTGFSIERSLTTNC